MLGILGYLYIVPPGKLEDRKHAPIERNGMLYGCGIEDDMGPLLAFLFAVKALVDTGVQLNKRIRFIVGTDEESLWRCINRYLGREEIPAFGFLPNSRFPVTYGGIGLLQVQ